MAARDARLAAAPAPLPGRARWPSISAAADEYRRVVLTGTYRYDLTTPVQALTEEGNGYWLMTPMCLADGPAGEAGGVVLVNRGFIATELGAPTRYAPARAGADACARALSDRAPATVQGLLRMDERAGAFTRSNDPTAHRWYARDVAQIATARGLAGPNFPHVAPFFVDAARGQNPADAPDAPQGGMTVVRFHNSHLVYAITWYALALMVGGAFWWIVRGASRGGAPDDAGDD
jgi:surfeit locus 1 family protein